MKSIGLFLRNLRAKKEIADAGRKGAVLGTDDGSKHFELSKRAESAALVALAAERASAPPDVLRKLNEDALAAAAERDEYFATEKIQIAKARVEAEERDREGN